MKNETNDFSRRLDVDPEVVVTELEDGEGVLLHLGSRKYFSLNKSGFEIWRLLGEGLTPAEVGERLETSYRIAPDRARAAVVNLLGELLDNRLVHLSS